MDVIYGLIPMMLIFGFLVVVVFIWMAKSGQFDDMDGAANRIFMEDEYPEQRTSANSSNSLNSSNDSSAIESVDETSLSQEKTR